MTSLRPSDETELADIVASAAADRRPLEIVGGGSKRAFGRPVDAEHALDVSRIAGIVEYEPAELVLTAKAATPLSTIRAELSAKRRPLRRLTARIKEGFDPSNILNPGRMREGQ